MTRTLFLAALRSFALATAYATARAFLVGLLLGSLVWGMAQARPGDPVSLAMAAVTLVAGAASFICHALAQRPDARGRVQRWMLALGTGALLALQALNYLG